MRALKWLVWTVLVLGVARVAAEAHKKGEMAAVDVTEGEEPQGAEASEAEDADDEPPAEDPKDPDPYILCTSRDRNICRLAPSKYLDFVADQTCAVLVNEVNPLGPLKRVMRDLHRRFTSIPTPCVIAWVDPSLEPEYLISQADKATAPTEMVSLYNKGRSIPLVYKGKLREQAVFRWAIKNTFDIVHEVAEKADLSSYKDLKAFGMLSNPEENQALKKQYHELAKKVLDFNFVEVSGPKAIKEFGFEDGPVFMIMQEDKSVASFPIPDGIIDEVALRRFISDKRRSDLFTGVSDLGPMQEWREPLVLHIRHQSVADDLQFRDFANRFNGKDIKDEVPEHRAALDALMPAGFIMEDFLVNFVDLTSDTNVASFLYFASGKEKPAEGDDWVYVVDFESDLVRGHVLHTWDFQTLHKALADLRDGKLPQHLRSQKEAVQVRPTVPALTSDTLKTEVIDKPGNALVLGYSPTCGFCLLAIDVMVAIAQEFAGTPNFAVYETDLTANDFPDFFITSYPKFIFFPAQDKSDPEVADLKTVEEVREFLKGKGIVPAIPTEGEL